MIALERSGVVALQPASLRRLARDLRADADRRAAELEAIAERVERDQGPTAGLLGVRDVMERCQVHRDGAFELLHAAGAIRLGRSLRIRPADLDAYLERLAAEARDP